MAHESIVHLNSDNFDSEVKQATVPVLVDFWAEWCGPCKMLSPVLDELAKEKGSAVKICKVDVQEQLALASQFGVQSIPTLLFFKDGILKDKHVGLTGKAQLAAKLEALA